MIASVWICLLAMTLTTIPAFAVNASDVNTTRGWVSKTDALSVGAAFSINTHGATRTVSVEPSVTYGFDANDFNSVRFQLEAQLYFGYTDVTLGSSESQTVSTGVRPVLNLEKLYLDFEKLNAVPFFSLGIEYDDIKTQLGSGTASSSHWAPALQVGLKSKVSNHLTGSLAYSWNTRSGNDLVSGLQVSLSYSFLEKQ